MFRRTISVIACSALSLASLGLYCVSESHASGHRPSPRRFVRVCAAPKLGSAACAVLARPPSSLSAARVPNQGAQGPVSEPKSGSPAVVFRHPLPGALSPQAIHAAYALPVSTASSALQVIGVVDAFDDPTAEADLAVYDRQYGLPACTAANGCFRRINQAGQESPLPATDGSWAAEISADLQMAHSACQACRIVLVEANSAEFVDLGAAVNAAVAAGATEINNSYESEGEEGSSALSLNASYYDHPGVVVTASAADCAYLGEACGTPVVSFPAASPDVIAVGGSALTEANGTWTSSAWEDTGSGCSQIFAAPHWQTALPNWPASNCGSSRLVADVAAVGAPETGVSVYDSTPGFENGPILGWQSDGGSSVASPIVAGEFALDGGSHGTAYPASTLYSHIGSAALYDIVTGSNGVCHDASACQAGLGYDGPSGVGSPIGLEAFSVIGAPNSRLIPTVLGAARLGQTLTEQRGQWEGHPGHRDIQWARCDRHGAYCHPIAGASTQRYTLSAADLGATVRVQETASNASGLGVPAASIPTEVVRAHE
jgi:hypothetical protein